MSREDPPLRIRLPEALRDQIKALAAENRRSMNAEIVARLEASLQVEEPKSRSDLALERLTAIAADMAGPDAMQASTAASIKALQDEVEQIWSAIEKLRAQSEDQK